MPVWLRKKESTADDKVYPSDRYAYKTNAKNPIYIPVNRILTIYQTEEALNEDKVKSNVANIRKGKALEPVVIGYKYQLHDGHHRLEAAKRAGHTHVPCVVGGRNERRVKAAEKRYRKVWKSMSGAVVKNGCLLIKSKLSTHLKTKVAAGDAHWVTVKSGPLEGRHLLIEGSRPKDGKKSTGKILAGHGIPPHVIEKITGATHAGDLEHEQSSGPNTKLPNLKGSEKQVAWADKIRKEILGELRHHIQTAERNIKFESSSSLSPMAGLHHRDKTPALKNGKETLENVLGKVESITSAKWFIDNRNGMWKMNLNCQGAISKVQR